MSSILPPGPLCFDIGSHHGETAEKLLTEHGASHVICVEPELQNYLLLHERFAQEDRVTCIHAAVTERVGLVKVSRAAAQDGLSTLMPEQWSQIYPDADLQPPQMCVGITLKTLFASFGVPGYVKVDVEGCEEYVITGMLEARSRPHLLSFEFHGARTQVAVNCLHMLEEMGYSKALCAEEELDLCQHPDRSLFDVRLHLARHKPNWGNVLVSR